MNFTVGVLVFIVVLFLYVHIVAQYKKSEDLEIYEMDFEKNSQLQEVCDVKQPFLFKYNSVNPQFFEKVNDETISDLVNSEEVVVKEIADYWNAPPDKTAIDFVALPHSSFQILISTDTKSRYFTENNDEFIQETTKLQQLLRDNDDFLKPIMTLQTKYDWCMGSKGVVTPMRYHTNTRRFISVNSGKITVKMTPFKSSKYLHPRFSDHQHWSPVNVWNTQEEYLNDTEKMKIIDVDVSEGTVIYIPPYWWYSIKYNNTDTLISQFTYVSVMNSLANSLDWIRRSEFLSSK